MSGKESALQSRQVLCQARKGKCPARQGKARQGKARQSKLSALPGKARPVP
jgi:hypothetical protein